MPTVAVRRVLLRLRQRLPIVCSSRFLSLEAYPPTAVVHVAIPDHQPLGLQLDPDLKKSDDSTESSDTLNCFAEAAAAALANQIRFKALSNAAATDGIWAAVPLEPPAAVGGLLPRDAHIVLDSESSFSDVLDIDELQRGGVKVSVLPPNESWSGDDAVDGAASALARVQRELNRSARLQRPVIAAGVAAAHALDALALLRRCEDSQLPAAALVDQVGTAPRGFQAALCRLQDLPSVGVSEDLARVRAKTATSSAPKMPGDLVLVVPRCTPDPSAFAAELAHSRSKHTGHRKSESVTASTPMPNRSEGADVVGGRDGVGDSMISIGGRIEPDQRVLLHSCCAPCSGAMIEQMLSEGNDVTILFYNPNIHPREEYDVRKEENKRFAAFLGVDFVDLDYDVDEWYARAKGMEFDPERGDRCTMCFDMRFEKTAEYAQAHGFQYITTTNATSRWKDAEQVNRTGVAAVAKYPGVTWWSRDWQTPEMTDRKYRVNAERSFYKQEYCGCSYSLRDTNMYRKQAGLPPAQVAGSQVYNDPIKDSEEESPEVVAEFFDDLKRPEKERLRQLREEHRQRRKDARQIENNNW